jgi:mannitol-1-phosphate 5-dehydrogenase
LSNQNTIGATSRLREHVEPHLSEEGKAYIKEYVGFVDCSVDRIVPPFDPAEHNASSKLDVGVEGFYEWIVEGPSLAQPAPEIKGWRVVDALKKYNERKLFTLNTGHAIAAYLGVLKGKKTIDEAIEDKEIRDVVYGALQESGQALVKKHDFEQGHHGRYINKIMERYKVRTHCFFSVLINHVADFDALESERQG